MIFETELNRYCLKNTASIKEALLFLNKSKAKILFLIDEYHHIIGSLTDGDIRRWMTIENTPNMDTLVEDIVNRQFSYATVEDSKEKIASKLSEKISHLPILDHDGRINAIARAGNPTLSIGNHSISKESSTFIIAEIGNNHNGNFELGKQLVDEAAQSGADAVKFQMRDMETLYGSANSKGSDQDLGSQYVLDLLERFQLPNDKLLALFDYATSLGLEVLCTPFDLQSAAVLNDYGISAYKVASADLTNHDLIKTLISHGKPIILSTGMATESEISESVDLLEKNLANYILLHCNSTYPAPFNDINLNYIHRLEELSSRPVGYSGHERGIAVPIGAVAKGAKVIEKHFTLDRTMEGNDHRVSLLPSEFKEMVDSIRAIESALGSRKPRQLSQGEIINRETLGKSVVAARPIAKGKQLTESDLLIRSPGKGLQPNRKSELIGRQARRDFLEGDFFYESDISESQLAKPKDFSLPMQIGVPVRYHDVNYFIEQGVLQFVEFHFSYKDLELSPQSFLKGKKEIDFVVHAPELFSGDHTLDLCSSNEEYRIRSIKEMQRVIDRTIELKQFFKGPNKPCIVVNVGGFSSEGFISKAEKQNKIEILKRSFAQLDNKEVNLIPQTMPPFPWHFGGQQYHNLFVDADEIVAFCEETGYQLCFDTSHTALACNYYDWNFKEYCQKVLPHTAHIHLADAKGKDGEGLQIGKGDMDIKGFFEQCRNLKIDVTWLPEIWQGHKDFGRGFWEAFNIIEELLNESS